jgi:hypothetical protein
MDPFTFGMVAISTFGGGLLAITALEHKGIKVNDTAIKIVMELIKAGGLLYLFDQFSKFFL